MALIALLAVAGVTIVGMSMVLEVVVAHDKGVMVLVLSLVMNMVIGVFLSIGVIKKATMESMVKGGSAETVLLLRFSTSIGNNDK
jgi:purine nucleoside phosphorylase